MSNIPSDLSETGKAFMAKDMTFAVAVSACEDLKQAMVYEETAPSQSQAAMRTEEQYGVMIESVETAFKPFVGNIVMTGLKNGFDAIIRDGFESTEQVDDVTAIVRAARALFGTW